jgi:hypothetical protein
MGKRGGEDGSKKRRCGCGSHAQFKRIVLQTKNNSDPIPMESRRVITSNVNEPISKPKN